LYDLNGKPSQTPDERYRCPVCTRPLARSEGARKVDADAQRADAGSKKAYWYCLGYNKGCKVTLADDDGRPAKAWRCPQCAHLLKQRKGKTGVFWGCSQYPLCQASFPDHDDEPRFDKDLTRKKRSL
jgi:ssDNA-binding Zn-finger/Zn-ribbon topoisomerase 1